MERKDFILLEFLSKQTGFFEFREYTMPPELKGEFLFDLKSSDSIAVRLFALGKYGLVNNMIEHEQNLKMQQLETDVMNLTNQLADYNKNK